MIKIIARYKIKSEYSSVAKLGDHTACDYLMPVVCTIEGEKIRIIIAESKIAW